MKFTVNQQKNFLELKISTTYTQNLSNCQVTQMSVFGLCVFTNPHFFRIPFKMFIIVVPFAGLAERDVTRTTFKYCRNFCSFTSKSIVTAYVTSPWCTDLQQGMLLDQFLCDGQQASRFNHTAQLVSCARSCNCHLKLKMWQWWIWKVFDCKVPICKTEFQDPSKLPVPWVFYMPDILKCTASWSEMVVHIYCSNML